MSDLAVRWVAIAPSAWQRRLRCWALALSAGVLAALLVVRFHGSELGAMAAGVTLTLAAAAVAARRTPSADTREWRIGSDGCIVVRHEDGVCRNAVAVFVSPALVVLRAGARTLEIWRDAAPIAAFRRLAVAARWPARHAVGATLRARNPSDAAERT